MKPSASSPIWNRRRWQPRTGSRPTARRGASRTERTNAWTSRSTRTAAGCATPLAFGYWAWCAGWSSAFTCTGAHTSPGRSTSHSPIFKPPWARTISPKPSPSCPTNAQYCEIPSCIRAGGRISRSPFRRSTVICSQDEHWREGFTSSRPKDVEMNLLHIFQDRSRTLVVPTPSFASVAGRRCRCVSVSHRAVGQPQPID